jgi:hypothetical protein
LLAHAATLPHRKWETATFHYAARDPGHWFTVSPEAGNHRRKLEDLFHRTPASVRIADRSDRRGAFQALGCQSRSHGQACFGSVGCWSRIDDFEYLFASNAAPQCTGRSRYDCSRRCIHPRPYRQLSTNAKLSLKLCHNHEYTIGRYATSLGPTLESLGDQRLRRQLLRLGLLDNFQNLIGKLCRGTTRYQHGADLVLLGQQSR